VEECFAVTLLPVHEKRQGEEPPAGVAWYGECTAVAVAPPSCRPERQGEDGPAGSANAYCCDCCCVVVVVDKGHWSPAGPLPVLTYE
jgi:hypothetical protein